MWKYQPTNFMNLNSTIIPKSDQTNADDLLSGPRTIKITSVQPGSKEQPVSIGYENDAGRPYKPSKSMRRVLVTIWGAEGGSYIGKRITLYCDPEVKFGGDKVGGIKISHASDITQPVTINLTETRGRRKPFVVQPLIEEVAKPAVELTNLPESWPTMTTEERGANRASLGMESLQVWWKTLSADERKTLKPKLDAEWKAEAEKFVAPPTT